MERKAFCFIEIEAQVDGMRKKATENVDTDRFVGLGEEGGYDEEIFQTNKKSRHEDYDSVIGGQEEEEDDAEMRPAFGKRGNTTLAIVKAASKENALSGEVSH